MSLATDQAAKDAKRAAGHARHIAVVVTPIVNGPDPNTDPPTVLVGGVPTAYPSPPF